MIEAGQVLSTRWDFYLILLIPTWIALHSDFVLPDDVDWLYLYKIL